MGLKTIESRTWTTTYRGPLLIHAAKTPARIDAAFAAALVGVDPMLLETTGVVVGMVELRDCRPMKRDDEAAALRNAEDGLFAWDLGAPVRLEATSPTTGRLGLFDVEWAPAGAEDLSRGR
jgi:hypothetical protein